jgi:hypothetical protein
MSGVKKDKVLLGASLAGGRVTVRERADGAYDVGVMYEVRDGQPLPEGEFCAVDEQPGPDGWRESETLYTRSSSGPPQVATRAYCKGYERIFGKQRVGQA